MRLYPTISYPNGIAKTTWYIEVEMRWSSVKLKEALRHPILFYRWATNRNPYFLDKPAKFIGH